jgi:prepilin peptidase CpaA
MGAGDVKLLAGIGAFAGPFGALWVLLFGSILGGLLSLVSLCRLDRAERARVGHNLLGVAIAGRLELPEPSALSRARGIPFGVALAAAGFIVLLLGVGR